MGIDQNKRKCLVRVCLYYILGAALFMALIFPVRAMLNVLNRADYIIQRLDDYPRMYENFRLEAEEWRNWKQADDYAKRAEQAALIYVSDEKHESEREKLSYIAKILDVERAAVISSDEYRKYAEKNSNKGLDTYSSKLPIKNPINGELSGYEVRISCECLEQDKELLTYQVFSELLSTVDELNKNIDDEAH